jgi:hypothetical protein
MIGLPHQYYSCFKNAIKTADDLEKSDTFVHYKISGAARKLHPGHPSVLTVICDKLNQFVFETREQGIQVSTRMVQQHAHSTVILIQH